MLIEFTNFLKKIEQGIKYHCFIIVTTKTVKIDKDDITSLVIDIVASPEELDEVSKKTKRLESIPIRREFLQSEMLGTDEDKLINDFIESVNSLLEKKINEAVASYKQKKQEKNLDK